MSGGVRRGGQEGPAHSGHSRDGGGGGGGGLQGGDLQVVPVAHLVCLGGAEGGHPGESCDSMHDSLVTAYLKVVTPVH